jgi:hypothetical protein
MHAYNIQVIDIEKMTSQKEGSHDDLLGPAKSHLQRAFRGLHKVFSQIQGIGGNKKRGPDSTGSEKQQKNSSGKRKKPNL